MKKKSTCSPIFSEEERIALLDGFQKQNTHTTAAEYAKANNVNKNTFFGWSVRYGIPLGFHHRNHRDPRKRFPEEQKLALLEGFQKQNTYTTIESYAKANNVKESTLGSWSVLYGIPLGNHHTKVFSEEQKLALLEGFQKQNTHTTVAEYAKANNVSIPALCRWAVRYGVRLGWHHTKRIKKKQTHADPLLEELRNQHHISQE